MSVLAGRLYIIIAKANTAYGLDKVGIGVFACAKIPSPYVR